MTAPHTPQQPGHEPDEQVTSAEQLINPEIEPGIPSIFSDFDLYLFGQGRHYHIYDKFGAQLRTINGVAGVNFALWAPNARTVSVIGNFNGWNRSATPMLLRHQDLGVWECFVPGLQSGEIYKYAIYSRFNNYTVDKTDPYGFFADLPPRPPTTAPEIHQPDWQNAPGLQRGGNYKRSDHRSLSMKS